MIWEALNIILFPFHQIQVRFVPAEQKSQPSLFYGFPHRPKVKVSKNLECNENNPMQYAV